MPNHLILNNITTFAYITIYYIYYEDISYYFSDQDSLLVVK